jgi:5-methylcytosine-specific restriction endonuclease McrA
MSYRYAKIEKCQAGDKIEVTFNVPSNVYLMTNNNFDRYTNNLKFVSANAIGTSQVDLIVPFDGDWFLVVDPSSSLEGLEANYNVIKVVGLEWIDVNAKKIIVHNTSWTGDLHQFDKADYWEKQTGIHLQEKDNICCSCHENVSREDMDEAQVKISYVTNSKLYLVPICNRCNRSKEDKDFIVPTNWLVEAPQTEK